MGGHTPSWSLRPADPEDCGVLSQLVLEVTRHQGRWPADRSAAEERDWLERYTAWSRTSLEGPDQLRVIEIDGATVGRLRTEWDRVSVAGGEVPRLRLHGIQLLPPFQGQGVGTALIRQLQDEVAERGGVMDLGVEHPNTGARRLYERLGFVEVGLDDEEVQLRWVPRQR